MESNPPAVTSPISSKISGIGGWLILPAINLALMLMIGPVIFYRMLNQPHGSSTDIAAGTVLLVVAYSAACTFAFFRKRKATRYLMIAFYAAALLSSLVFALYAPGWTFADPLHAVAFYIRSALEVTFVLYFILSKRVLQTFVF